MGVSSRPVAVIGVYRLWRRSVPDGWARRPTLGQLLECLVREQAAWRSSDDVSADLTATFLVAIASGALWIDPAAAGSVDATLQPARICGFAVGSAEDRLRVTDWTRTATLGALALGFDPHFAKFTRATTSVPVMNQLRSPFATFVPHQRPGLVEPSEAALAQAPWRGLPDTVVSAFEALSRLKFITRQEPCLFTTQPVIAALLRQDLGLRRFGWLLPQPSRSGECRSAGPPRAAHSLCIGS